jgi:Zn-dependent metalloprotease/subtilisin-like proprotein convertase family protein
MRKISLFFIFIVFLGLSKNSIYAQTLEGKLADNVVKGAEKVILNNQSSIPSFISFSEAGRPAFNDPVKWLRENFKISNDYGLVLLSKDKDNLGFVHYRYGQTLNGIPAAGTMWIVHVKNQTIFSMNGFLASEIKESTPKFSNDEALSKALDYVKAGFYKWQSKEEEALLKRMKNDEDATYFPTGELYYSFNQGRKEGVNYRLAYRFDIYAQEPLSRHYVFIDASTGEVIDVQNRIHETNSTGTAVTGYSGIQQIITDSVAGNYLLRETGRGAGLGIETYNMLKGTNYGNAVDFSDADNYWNNVNTNRDQYATDAHFAAEKTYDYFYYYFGRNSIDNNGLKLLTYVHYSNNYVNAFWDGLRMTYGDGNATFTPLTTLDIGGHEITHGLTEYTADLIYSYESGALNESFSDIFGTAIEWYVDSLNFNWTLGEDIGSPFRSLSNPNAHNDPDTYLGLNWYAGTGDNGGVHTNSGVQNHWFYLLSVGGSDTNDIGNVFNVAGIGVEKAAAIAFRTLTVYLTSTSQYIDARNYSIQSAIDLFGTCSPEFYATREAWYAVGVGGPINLPTTISVSSFTTICSGDSLLISASATVGSSYQWYLNNSLIPGASQPGYHATASGYYTVVTNNCGFIDTSNSIGIETILLDPILTPSGSVTDCDSIVLHAGNRSGYRVQWNKDNLPIAGANDTVYTARQSGIYSFTLQTEIQSPQTFSSTNVVSIPDNTCSSPAFSTITVSGLPSQILPSGISILMNLTHTWNGDLEIMLEAPNGDILGLSDQAGGSSDGFTNTSFSDSGLVNLSLGVAPFTGVFKPWPVTFISCINTTKTSFASLGNGIINPNGDWKLRVYDRGGLDIGTIDNWSITFPSVTNPMPDCGPVTTFGIDVSIGNNATISINAKHHSEYSWTTISNLQTSGRKYGIATSLNDKTYYGLGDNINNNDWWEYDPLTDSWAQKADCKIGLHGGVAFSIEGKVYVACGYSSSYVDSLFEWDPVTNNWTTKNSFDGGGRAFMASASVNGKGYLFGGKNDFGFLNDIWEYDPLSDQWSFKANFVVPGFNGISGLSAVSSGTNIYFGLGQSCDTPCIPVLTANWYEYNTLTNSVIPKSSFPGVLRNGQSSFSISDLIYIAFGNSGILDLVDTWLYNSTNDSWNLCYNYSGLGRTGSSATVAKNKAYLFSGDISSSPIQDVLQFKVINNICSNSPAAVTLQASSGTSYLWSTGETTQSISGLSDGDYSVTVNNSGCSSTAHTSIAFFPDPVPDIIASGPLSFCTGGSVTLSTNPALQYSWNTGDTTNSILVNVSGNYSVTLTGAGGCSNASTPVAVNANTNPPITIIPDGSTNICAGSDLVLSAYSYQSIPYAPIPGSGSNVTLADEQVSAPLPIGFSYSHFGNTYQYFHISANGFIAFTASSSGCCLGQLLPNPQQPNNLISMAWADLYPPAGGTIDYFTTGNAPNRKLIVNFTGVPHYPSGNPVTTQLILYESTNIAEVHTTTMPSNGDQHTMGMENVNGTQAVIIPSRNRKNWSASNEGIRLSASPLLYQWSNGATTPSITVNDSGTYSITVTDSNGCTTATPAVITSVVPLPVSVITADGPLTFCQGDSVVLSASVNNSYQWNSGQTTQNLSVTSSGNFSVAVTDSNGCSTASDTVSVSVNPCFVNLGLKLFIQGFYKGAGIQAAVADKLGNITLCDTIHIELRDTTVNYNLIHTITGTVATDGSGEFTFPVVQYANKYFIVVKHRNSIDTWSKYPVEMDSSVVVYDFSDNAGKAYGDNLADLGDGNFAIYNGDINGDGYIDDSDIVFAEDDAMIFSTGYILSDLTGDGVTESTDCSLVENNFFMGIMRMRP